MQVASGDRKTGERLGVEEGGIYTKSCLAVPAVFNRCHSFRYRYDTHLATHSMCHNSPRSQNAHSPANTIISASHTCDICGRQSAHSAINEFIVKIGRADDSVNRITHNVRQCAGGRRASYIQRRKQMPRGTQNVYITIRNLLCYATGWWSRGVRLEIEGLRFCRCALLTRRLYSPRRPSGARSISQKYSVAQKSEARALSWTTSYIRDV